MIELTPVVVALAALVSTIYNVIHGKLDAVFGLFAPLAQLRAVDFSKLKADLLVLSPEDRLALEKQFDAALTISDATVLKKFVDSANVLDGAVSLGEDVVKAVRAFSDRALEIFAKVKEIIGSGPITSIKSGVSIPSWLHLPAWFPSWLWPTVMGVLTSAILPALAAALPAEAPLILDLIAFLKGGGASPRLQSAYGHYHAAGMETA